MISESTFTVQGHGVHTAFQEMTDALAARPDIDVKVNKFRRRADITHIQTFGPYSLLHLWFGSGKKVISVHVVPDSLVGSIVGAKRFYWFAKWYMKHFYGRADLLLSVSKMVDDTLREQLGIHKPSRVLYNTVDMRVYQSSPGDKSKARTALALPADAQVVVSCAQIQPRKRFDIFCEAAKAMPDARFIWIGGIPFKHLGADYGLMQKMLDEKPANVTVTGVIDHDDVRRYLQAADVFFLPSDQENHPMAVLEAAGAGLPIVVRDIPEYDDTFKNDVVRGTDDTFIELIKKLASDEAFRAKAIAGSKDIAKRFDSHAGGEQLVEAYKSIL
ncbi:MAG TPA: glycosyltransferase family 4 protein [Candidatus Saccharimonadales bacterium]|nr:glycosyltransferase family 4 protein [Candidatus Saccharimonadales bacterium]